MESEKIGYLRESSKSVYVRRRFFCYAVVYKFL